MQSTELEEGLTSTEIEGEPNIELSFQQEKTSKEPSAPQFEGEPSAPFFEEPRRLISRLRSRIFSHHKRNSEWTLQKKLILFLIIIFQIALIMMNVALIKMEAKNNHKNAKECLTWHKSEVCTYSNWTKINDTYIGHVETLSPTLNGTITCKKPSCVVLSSDKCYYRGDILVFHKKSGCVKRSDMYEWLGGMSIGVIGGMLFFNLLGICEIYGVFNALMAVNGGVNILYGMVTFIMYFMQYKDVEFV